MHGRTLGAAAGILGVALLGAGCNAASAGGGTSGSFEHAEDVTVAACQRDDTLGFPSAQVAVKNGSSKASTYTIMISFQTPDGATQYGEGAALVSRLEPGQQTTQTAQGAVQVPAGAQLSCKVSSAKRTQAF